MAVANKSSHAAGQGSSLFLWGGGCSKSAESRRGEVMQDGWRLVWDSVRHSTRQQPTPASRCKHTGVMYFRNLFVLYVLTLTVLVT